ncbi:hypothetical protein B0H14DRAFT_3503969 [Mycena olivaceomarginata]|nr:hypothetical protein B0H14DRAFT_3503969 [Mycena olivaceomarginata]
MSEDGSPPPATPRRKRSVRISKGVRKPPLPPANPYLDLEAGESGDSGEEENLDKYETDFIDDGDDVDHDDGTPIPWPRTPSPTPAKASGKASRADRTSVVDPTPISPMTTRSRSKNPTTPASKSVSTSVPGPTTLNTAGYQGSRTYAVGGVKSASVLPGTERGDTQAKLETLRTPSNITVSMDREQHEQFMLFMNSKKSTPKQVCFSAALYVLLIILILSAAFEGEEKSKVKGAPSEASTLASGTSQVGAAITKLPPPAWTTHSTTSKSAGPKVTLGLAGSNTTPNRMNQAVPSATNSSEEGDITSVQAGVKRKRSTGKDNDNAAASDSEMAVDVDQVSRPTKGARAVAKNVGKSVSNRQGALGGSKLPAVPSVEFARLKETSPEKKPKKDEIVLHTVDVKAVKELPDVCEVTNVELQDPMMQSIYALDLPNLRRGQVTTWSSNEGPGMFMLSEYPVINPELSIETVWALLLFVQKGHHINPARIDPRVHLSQDFDRITGLCGMVFDLQLMHVQLNMSALTFGTRGIPIDKYEKLGSPDRKGIQSTSSLYRKQTYTAPSDSLNYDDDIPVYDARHTGFDASVDIDNLRDILPMYKGEIPANSCTAVGYTISNFVKASGRSEEQHLSFNIQWVVVLGEPE